MRKLYYDPISTVSRPVVMFLAEHPLEIELVHVELNRGAQLTDWYSAVNPNQLVPTLEEDGFRLTESAAILRYLAAQAESPAYPAELRARARVDEALDWFNTNLYRDLGYGVVYPQLLDHMRVDDAQLAALRDWHEGRARKSLQVLDRHMIGEREFVAGDRFSIADMFGSAIVMLAELIDFDLESYPNVCRWLDRVKRRPSWAKANSGYEALVMTLKAGSQAA